MAKKGNSEGSIYKDKQGRWRGVVTLYCADGVPKRKYFYGKTKREVTEKVNNTLSEIHNNTYTEPNKITFYEWMSLWLDTYCRGELKQTSIINYETYIEKHIKPTIGNVRLQDLTPIVLQKYYQEKSKNGRIDGNGGLSKSVTLTIKSCNTVNIISGHFSLLLLISILNFSNPALKTTSNSLLFTNS